MGSADRQTDGGNERRNGQSSSVTASQCPGRRGGREAEEEKMEGKKEEVLCRAVLCCYSQLQPPTANR